MTVPSFIYRWQASPDEVVPTRNGWEIAEEDREVIGMVHDYIVATRAANAERSRRRNPTLRIARFAWALGAAPLTFNFPPFVSAWRPWKRPWDWERDGC